MIMELRPNRVKRKLAAGDIAYIAVGMTDPDDIDAFGPCGFDGVWLEGEHGAVDAANLGNLTRACDIWGLTSIVRVNSNDQGLIYRTFDRGAQGVCIPHVNTAAEAQNVVAGGKFAPLGQRGLFTSRQGYGVEDYFAKANDETLLMMLIEDIIAVGNLDEILAVEGFDSFIIGPVDLSISLGVAFDYESQVFQDAQAKLADAARRSGKPAGIGVYRPAFEAPSLQRAIDDGFSLILAGGDEPFLTVGCQQLAQIRAGLEY